MRRDTPAAGGGGGAGVSACDVTRNIGEQIKLPRALITRGNVFDPTLFFYLEIYD